LTRANPRRRAHVFGLRAEWIAAAWLLAKGYRVLARRFLVKGGEIDLVVQRGDAIAFVEVKAREEIDDALDAIREVKRRRISRAARAWLARNPWAAGATLRGDAVFVAPGRLPRHAVEAYRLDLD
jgi:putative endonuclease